MATKHYTKNVAQWISGEQGKHFCQCGCGREIVIKKHHFRGGIPKVIRGHLGRVDKGGISVVATWLAAQREAERQCACGCGGEIVVKQGHRYSGIPKYLSGHDPKTKENLSPGFNGYRNTAKDFWALADRQPNGCWLWQGRKDEHGYGIFFYRGKRRPASRVGFFLYYGHWPKNFACHDCPGGDNPSCVNPSHLFDGTQEDNMTDAAVKGRLSRKNTPEQVLKVVRLTRKGVTTKLVAERTGVSPEMVYQIMMGFTWTHITGIQKRRRKHNG